MSGRFAMAAAAALADRVRCAASIHGTGLIGDAPESPHRLFSESRGELYFACAENDRWMPRDVVETLRAFVISENLNAEVEVYPGTEHGFVFKDRHAYNRIADDRHWERLAALFQRNLS